MDSASVVLGQALPFGSPSPSSQKELRSSCKLVAMARRGPAIGILSSGFFDQGHLQYYNCNSKKFGSTSVWAAVMNGEEGKSTTVDRFPKKMKKKKQLKLLKELSRDLATFSQMGFGLDGGDGGLADQVNRDVITDAADVILERLQKVRAQEKEQKRKMKEEKAKQKALKMQMDCEMSSASSESSSSESNDSECEEVVNMKNLERPQSNQKGFLKEADRPITPPPIDPLQSNCTKTGTLVEENVISPKIEVCMGGKCKKSGGGMVLEELKKAVGIEGAVSGCKCMGKCKEGPNVKVLSGVGDNAVTSNKLSSLCIGVGVEDVEKIVANFMGQTSHGNNQMGFAGA